MTILRRKQPYRVPPLHSRWTRRRAQLPAAPGPPPPPPPDYLVTGTLTPDATGEYFEDGTHFGYPAYRREDSAWWIWMDYYGNPHIGTGKGIQDGWSKWGFDFLYTGHYGPDGGNTGTATVSEP